MKAKHLLFTVAIGATFAACTSEDNFNIAENNATDAKLSISSSCGCGNNIAR